MAHVKKYSYLFDYGIPHGTRFMTIDPGLGGTGWAIWESCPLFTLAPPYNSGSLSPPSALDNIFDRAFWVSTRLKEICHEQRLRMSFIELPAHMESAKGMMAEAKGDVIKLATIFGVVGGALREFGPVVPVSILDWKGQTNKKHTERRLLRRIPKYKYSTGADHEKDAIGIGLFVKGWY